MPARHLIVLAIPRGKVSANVGRLTVVLAPRLRVTGPLNNYTDWRNWAQRCIDENMAFRLTVNGVEAPAPLVPTSVAPNGEAWRAVFGPPASTTVPVRAHRFVDRSAQDLISTDTAQLDSFALGLLGAQTANGGPLTKDQITSQFPGILSFASTGSASTTVGNDADPTIDDYDQEFHDSLRMLSAHPHLMRVLGLAWDFEVPLPAPPYNWISVRTNWPNWSIIPADPEVGQVPMRTSVTGDFLPTVFRATHRITDWLRLSSSKYRVSQVAAAGVTGPLRALADVLADPNVDGETPIDIPALDDGGIGILFTDLAPVLEEQFDRQKVIEDGIDTYLEPPPGPPPLPPLVFAEDLTSGFRVDVATTGPTTSLFKSLHDRAPTGPYDFPANTGLSITPPVDEGWSSIAMSTDGTVVLSALPPVVTYFGDVDKREAIDETQWRVSDRVVAWNGWSLSTPMPGRTTTGDGDVLDRAPSPPRPEIPGNVVIGYEHINGTLPRLRYGWTYSLRGRCVDLAGSSVPLSAVAPVDALPDDVTFGRLAPVSGPRVVRRQSRPTPGVGDQPTVLVIKSELTQAPSTVVPTGRFLFPAAVSQTIVERHGLPNGGVDPAAYADIAARSAASLDAQCIVDPDTGEPVAGAAIVSGAVTPGPLTPDVTYLADPVGTGVAFHYLPGQTTDVSVPYGTWPTLEGVLVSLRAGTGAPAVDLANRVVSVSAPKGTMWNIAVSHTADPALVEHMKAVQSLPPEDRAARLASVVAGKNTTITKTTGITLVHAVRVPMTPPSFPSPITAERTQSGQTTLAFSGNVGAHVASTGHLAIDARWVDPIDDVADPGPSLRTSRAFVMDMAVPYADATTTGIAAGSFDLGDTKRRTLVLSSEAFSRYSTYFTEEIRFSGSPGATRLLDARGVSAPTVEVKHRSNGTVYRPDVDYTVDATTGVLTILSTSTMPASTPLRIRFVPRPLSRLSSEATANKSVRVQVPSSRAPSLPVVDSLIPASTRRVTTKASLIQVVYDGRVVRVGLARPWYSSGEREQLGVAVDAAGTLTRWGRDPLSIGAGSTTVPTAASFPLAKTTDDDVVGFDVAAHDVAYDTDRRLWTSDVLVNADFGYRPWVRLSLVRYQGLSVPGTEVSGTVECEPVRLGARRVVTAAKLPRGRVRVRLEGRDNVNEVRVVLQRKVRGITDPLLAWEDVSTTTLRRSGSRAASVHSGTVETAASGARRLVIEDYEPVSVSGRTSLRDGTLLAYREIIDLPSNW